jgi:hypothetical protein
MQPILSSADGVAEANWNIVAGNNPPYLWTFKDALGARLDLTGLEALLVITLCPDPVVLQSGSAELTILDQTDPLTKGRVRVTLTLALSELIPTRGLGAPYYLEFRNGSQRRKVLRGYVKAEATGAVLP